MVIYKYKIYKHGVNEIEMPIGAKVLSVHEQFGGLVLWALINDKQHTISRFFINVFTGEEFESKAELTYIDTTQMKSGLVVHTFEVEKNIAKENL